MEVLGILSKCEEQIKHISLFNSNKNNKLKILGRGSRVEKGR